MKADIAIIDVGHLYAPAFFAAESSPGSEGVDLNAIVNSCMVHIRGAARDYMQAICVFDCPPYRRSAVAPSYKANRPPKPPGYSEGIARLEKAILEAGIKVSKVQGYEADDLVASWVSYAVAREMRVDIHTSDKDLFQLVTQEVNVVSTRDGGRIGETEVFQKLGVMPMQVLDLLTLAGDASDGITGCPGIGAKTAVMLLEKFNTIEGVMQAARDGQLKPGVAAKLLDPSNIESMSLAAHLASFDALDASETLVAASEEVKEESVSEVYEAEVVESKSLAVSPQQTAIAAAGPAEMSVDDLVHRVEKLRDVAKRVMKEGVHFGNIPGVAKPSLLKPGAEILAMTFRLAPKFDVTEERDGDHRTYSVTCNLIHMPSGALMGSGMASCSTKESRYAWRKGSRKCPECGSEAIIVGKKEYGGGFICFAKKGGCGAKFPDGDDRILSQETGRIPNPDLPDTWNVVLKMANKRALVAAILIVTGASEQFTQDVEEMVVS